MSWQIISAIALIILAIVAIIKKVETRMTLLLAGFAMCVLAGHPMAAFQSFIKGMVNINLVPPICAAMGFAAAVTFSKCDEHLVVLLASLLKKIGGWLILIATVVTFLINIAIMSAAGTAATVGATLIPLMIRAGIKPAGAAAAVGGGTMMGLLVNPGCAHDIFIAKLGNSLIMCFYFKDQKLEAKDLAGFQIEENRAEFKVNPLKAIAPVIPMILLIISSVWFPKSGLDVVASMIIGVVYIALICLKNPNELVKAVFKGMGQGYGSVIGLIVAAGVFAVGMKEIGLIPAFIDMLKQSNEIARWGASFGPFLLAVLTGSGEAAIWAFNQAVTPSAASFGMNPEALGLLCAVAGQFGRTASPLAGCIIIVAGIAKVSPFEISKRVGLSMLISLIVAALVLV